MAISTDTFELYVRKIEWFKIENKPIEDKHIGGKTKNGVDRIAADLPFLESVSSRGFTILQEFCAAVTKRMPQPGTQ